MTDLSFVAFVKGAPLSRPRRHCQSSLHLVHFLRRRVGSGASAGRSSVRHASDESTPHRSTRNGCQRHLHLAHAPSTKLRLARLVLHYVWFGRRWNGMQLFRDSGENAIRGRESHGICHFTGRYLYCVRRRLPFGRWTFQALYPGSLSVNKVVDGGVGGGGWRLGREQESCSRPSRTGARRNPRQTGERVAKCSLNDSFVSIDVGFYRIHWLCLSTRTGLDTSERKHRKDVRQEKR